MSPDSAVPQPEQVAAFFQKHRTGLATLVFTDLLDSTALLHQVGDQAGVTLLRRRRQILREVLHSLPQAEEIETAGDSFLLVFAKPSDAVRFALQSQARLRKFSQESGLKVQERMGIHLGEVVISEFETEVKAKDLYGIQLAACARVMSLAAGGQVLLTRGAFDSARQVLKGEDIPGVGGLRWVSHGPYLLKGIEEPVEVCEVAEVGESELVAPKTSEKAQRQVRADEEPVLGWRPAVGQVVPNTQWMLEQKLGEGGFGEVWVGRHQTIKERRVFKFCFRAERLRSLKHEVTLFRLLKERTGEHPNIVRLYEVYFDQPPFYLEEEYVAGQDLRSWCQGQGGVGKVPLETRLEILAQAADALQAAHDAGIIHRDVKPGNILISTRKAAGRESKVEVKLTDFGIGQVVSQESLGGVTKAGFTMTLLGSESSSKTGTQLYMAPELLAGKPASIRSDIYSLGVVLYQLLVGDFTRPVTGDWVEDTQDSLLRDDLKHCLRGRPDDRFAGAGQLAKNLRALPDRRVVLERQKAELAAREKAAYRRGVVRAASLAAAVVVGVVVLAIVALKQSQRAKAEAVRASRAAASEKQARGAAEENLYAADMNLAYQAWQERNLGLALELLQRHRPVPLEPDLRGWEWRYLWSLCQSDALYTFGQHSNVAGGVFGVALSPNNQLLASAGSSGEVHIWEVASRRLLATPNSTSAAHTVAFSPDGRWLAFGTGRDGGALWDIQQPPFFATSLAQARGRDGVALWDIQQGKEVGRFLGTSWGVFGRPALGFSPSGRQLATGMEYGPVILWDLATHAAAVTLKGHSVSVSSLVFSPDGRTLLTGSWDRTLRVWSVEKAQEIAVFTNHTHRVQCVAISPDGRTAASGSWDATVRIWDLARQRQVAVLTNHTRWVSALAFSPDGSLLASASADYLIKFWDASTWSEVSTLKGSLDEVYGIAFSSDGKTLFSGTKDGRILAWNGRPRPSKTTVLKRPDDAALPWGFWISPSNGTPICWHSNQTLTIWDPHTLRQLSEHPTPPFDQPTNTVARAHSPGEKRLALTTRQGLVFLWDVERERQMACWTGWPSDFCVLDFSPGGKLLALVVAGKGLRLWNVERLDEVATLPKSDATPSVLCFTANDQTVAVGNSDGTVEVWDIPNRTRPADWKAHRGRVTGVAVLADGKSLATASWDNSAKLWDIQTRREIRRFTRGLNAFYSLAVSPDGQRVAGGTADGGIKIWDSTTGREMATLRGVNDWVDPSAPDRWDAVLSLNFLPPNGDILVSGTVYEVRLWRAPSWAEIEAMEKRTEGKAP